MYTPNKCSCIVCKKEFSIRGIHSHYLTAHTNKGNERVRLASLKGSEKGSKSTQLKFKKLAEAQQLEYDSSPNYCKFCNSKFSFSKRKLTFCNSSCAARYNNKHRDYEKTKQTWKHKSINEPKPVKQPKPPYSIIYNCTCAHCKVIFLQRKRKKYCTNCEHLYSHEGRAKYWFSFNIFHYPNLFDLSLIKQYGFRDNKTNPNGITRDHKVSVNESIRNNYDPYYIKHPLNCDLMFFNENNKKKCNSSITYQELVRLVDEFDNSQIHS